MHLSYWCDGICIQTKLLAVTCSYKTGDSHELFVKSFLSVKLITLRNHVHLIFSWLTWATSLHRLPMFQLHCPRNFNKYGESSLFHVKGNDRREFQPFKTIARNFLLFSISSSKFSPFRSPTHFESLQPTLFFHCLH